MKLSDRFDSLWQRCGARALAMADGGNPGDEKGDGISEIVRSSDRSHALYADLATAYGESRRSYHTLEHIEHCLVQIDGVANAELVHSSPVDLDLIELAIWYHDMIYVPEAHNNELQSAELFRRIATDTINDAMIDDVYRLIMVTVHRTTPEQADEAIMVDVDLSSFGMPWDDFYRDSINVRSEMSHMSDVDFANGQGRFLRSLIERESIYGTEHFRALYEERAHQNIESYLSQL